MPTISGFTVVLADRVKETTSTTGTGTYSLNGAATGFRTFVAGVGSGNRCPYAAQLGSGWEVGVGTVTSGAPATLSRDVILASSNSGNAVNWGAGAKDIFLDVPAGYLTQIPAADIGDFSVNTTEMRTQTNPGEQGSESLATTIAGELARLRFAIAELKGTTYWYETAGQSLAGVNSGLQSPITTTSDTSHDFTGISSAARRLTLMLQAVSTNGTSDLVVRLGTSGGIDSDATYQGAIMNTGSATMATTAISNATAFRIHTGVAAGETMSGTVVVSLLNASDDIWVAVGNITSDGNPEIYIMTGRKNLGGDLDRIRLTTAGGSDTFDAGSINLLVE